MYGQLKNSERPHFNLLASLLVLCTASPQQLRFVAIERSVPVLGEYSSARLTTHRLRRVL